MRVLATLVAAMCTGCGTHGSATPVSTSRPATSGPIASCARPSPIGEAPGSGGPEVRGFGRGMRFWGLVMARRYPLVAGPHVVKVVWRVTGSGPLRLAAHDGRGHRLALAWGPEPHGGSNYRRLGDEWGSGYHFRHPGCYRLTARRGRGRGEAWLRVGPRPD